MKRHIDVATKDPPTVCIVENDTSLRRGLVRIVRGHRLTVDIHLGKMSGFDLHDRLTQMGLNVSVRSVRRRISSSHFRMPP